MQKGMGRRGFMNETKEPKLTRIRKKNKRIQIYDCIYIYIYKKT
jgi:hypothetical protein